MMVDLISNHRRRRYRTSVLNDIENEIDKLHVGGCMIWMTYLYGKVQKRTFLINSPRKRLGCSCEQIIKFVTGAEECCFPNLL